MKQLHLLFVVLLCFAFTKKEEPISEWRGPNRSGVYNENGLLKQWPADGPQLIWAIEATGRGYGSPVVAEDQLFITGEKDSTAYLYAYNLKGQLLWKSVCGNEWVKNFPGSRSTPTVVGDLIYVCTGKGDISCFDKNSGDKKWSLNMISDLQGVINMFGYSQSLLVNNDLVYCQPGGADNNVVALKRFTGQKVWSQKAKGEIEAYGSPIVVKRGERDLLLTFSEMSFLGIDGKSGELLFTHKMDTAGNLHGNIPVVDGNDLIYTEGDGNRTVKFKLAEDGSSISEVWRNRSFDNIMGGVVKLGDKIYGTAHRQMYLKCLDMNTGQVTDSLKMFRGSTIAADGMLYVYTEKGMVNLVDPKPEGMQIVSSFKVTKGDKEFFSHPVIHDGVLYIRHGEALMAYWIKK
ncbi:MAG TPA: PQQ-binding-like beta-propeller repeat protein [Prolixibacteraceae bacterium]|nr:PQQ-binding-like beta-propeller repeat protein [Prolixibacteraceae bacterium]